MYCEICGSSDGILIPQYNNNAFRCERHNKQSCQIKTINKFFMDINPKEKTIKYYVNYKEVQRIDNIVIVFTKHEIPEQLPTNLADKVGTHSILRQCEYLELRSLLNPKLVLDVNLEQIRFPFRIEFKADYNHKVIDAISVDLH